MTATTTRSRTTTATPTRRPANRDVTRPWAYVDGANALQIGYDDPLADESYARPDPLTDPVPAVEPDGGFGYDGEAPPTAAPVKLPRPSIIVLSAVLVIAAVLGVLVLNTKINENSFALDNLRSQQSQLDVQEQQLAQQLADLESAGNLSAQAARLGLVPAGAPGFLNLPTGKVVGEPKPASGNSTGPGTPTNGDPGR